MILKKVELENFLSFGTRQVIEFTDDEPLWVISGPNGVGKSTVFDAVTFCLFGMHRGRGNEVEPLLRHGANGFSVSLEFEFNGQRYRITRSRSGRSAVQSLQQWKDQSWQRVPHVETADQIKRWSEQTLGVDFEGFKASVLLRQGKADEIVDATPANRMKILKGIIGLNEYEKLADRVKDRAKGAKAEVDRLTAQRASRPDITAEQVQAAQADHQAAEEALTQANQVRDEAIAALEQSRLWVELQAEQHRLEREIQQATTRLAEREHLQQQVEQLARLQRFLPDAMKFHAAQARLNQLQPQLADWTNRHTELANLEQQQRRDLDAWKLKQADARSYVAEQANQLRQHEQNLLQLDKIINLAQDVAVLRQKARSFADDLDSQWEAVERDWQQANQQDRGLAQQRAAQQAEQKRLQQALQRISSLEVGVACSQCGQPVTAEHAERERTMLREQLEDITRQIQQVNAELVQVQQHLQQTEARRSELQRLRTARDQAVQRLQDREQDLTRELNNRPGEADHNQLLQEREDLKLAQSQAEQARQQARAAEQQAEHQVQALARILPNTQAQLQTLTHQLSQAREQHSKDTALREYLRSQLPQEWQSLSTDQLQHLQQEQQQLEAADVVARLQQTERDEHEQAARHKQFEELRSRLEQIPAAARRSVAEAEAHLKQAREAVGHAELLAQTRRDQWKQLTEQLQQQTGLTAQLNTAERQLHLLARLADLLGRKGLQRELVREAEERIAVLANDTVQNLSDGDLRIELNRSANNEEEALVLQVRRGDSPTPTRVEYLSGSQKFRVAIALALAIGRYASGQARPLQSVIIDEGFGSLDKNGLRAVAEELTNLKKHLERIILVSHQDEFTEHFPVVVQLAPSESGTVAEVCRRR